MFGELLPSVVAVSHHRVVQADDVPVGEDFASETLMVRWAVDPTGRRWQILAAVPGKPEFPAFMWKPSDGLKDRFILRRLNRLLESGRERGRAQRSGPPIWYLEVWRVDSETLVLEEQLTNAGAVRRRIDDLVDRATAGDLATGD